MVVPALFMCHANADNTLCDRYRRTLWTRGCDIWYDRSNVRGGRQLTDEIERQLRRCSVLVVLLTPAAVTSTWVQLEIDAFRSLAVHDPRRVVLAVPIRP